MYHLFIVRTRAARRAARAPRRARRLDRGALPVPDPPHRGLRGPGPRRGQPARRRAARRADLHAAAVPHDVRRRGRARGRRGRATSSPRSSHGWPAGSCQPTTPRSAIAVVGYGYWGPNLVRNVIERPELEFAGAVRARPRARGRVLRAERPARRSTRSLDELLARARRSTPSSSRRRRARTTRSCKAALLGRQARARREAAGDDVRRRARPDRDRRGARRHADARATRSSTARRSTRSAS